MQLSSHKPTPYSSSLSSRGYCNICYTPYDLQNYKPLLICSNDHCICKKCLKTIKNTNRNRRNIQIRCPFCRQDVSLDKIRINQDAVDFIVMKSRKMTPVGSYIDKLKEISQVQQRGERMITQNTAGNDHQYLHQSQFFSERDREMVDNNSRVDQTFDMLQQHPQAASVCNNLWILILYIYLLLFHMPLAMTNLYLSHSQPPSVCMDNKVPHSSDFTLRYQWTTNSYIQLLIGMTTLYFVMAMHVGVLQIDGMRRFQFLLVFFGEVMCIVNMLIYAKIITNQNVFFCNNVIVNILVLNVVAKCVASLLGIALLARFFDFIFDRE